MAMFDLMLVIHYLLT